MTNDTQPTSKPRETTLGRKIIGVATGVDSLGASVRHNVAIPAKIGFDIADAFRQIFVRPDCSVESDATDAKQRFKDAMRQYKVPESDLARRQKVSHYMFNTCMGVAAIIVFMAIAFIDFHAGFFSVACRLLPAVASFTLFVVAMVKWGFDNYRLRNRSLVTLREYLRDTKGLMTVKSGINLFIGLSLALSLSGSPVLAQTASSDTCTSTGSYTSRTLALPCGTDVYRNAIENIFPAVGPLTEPNITLTGESPANSNGKSGLQEALTAFTSVLMSVAMFLLSFQLVATMVSVSQEGSLLSQKWSVVWAPIRLSMGVGFLVPIKSGFCLAQIVVLYVALWGGSLANIIWVSYLNGMENPEFSNSAQVPYMSSYLRDAEIEDLCYTVLDRVSTIRKKQGVEPLDLGVSRHPDSGLPSGPYSNPRKTSGYSGTYASQITSIARSDQSNDGVKASLTSWIPGLGGESSMTMQYNIWDFGVCGSIKIPTISDTSATSGAATTSNSAIQRMLTFDKTRLTIFSQFLTTMHRANQTLVNNTVNVASAPSSSLQAMMSQLVSTYNTAVNTANTAAAKATVTFIDNAGNGNIEQLNEAASKYGWVTAGAFYMNISRMQGMTNQFLNMMPQADSYTTNISDSQNQALKILGTGDASDVFTKTANAIEKSYDSYTACKVGDHPSNCGTDPRDVKSAASISDNLYKNASKAGNFNGITTGNNTIGLDNPSYGFGELSDYISKQVGSLFYEMAAATGADNTSSKTGKGNPGSELQAMVDFGQNIICLVEVMWAIMFLAAKVSSAKSWVLKGAVKAATYMPGEIGTAATAAEQGAKFVAYAAGLIKTVLGALFFVGIIHAYVLPMLPFIQFTMFVVSMLIIVVEAIIAAPIWAFMHIRLDGNELIMQQQRTGYMLMFNLFLRAPLGMLGMLLSISVFNAAMLVMSITFWPAVQAACGEGSAGLIGMMVMLVLMSYMHYQLALRSFSLISAVPARVSKWFGAGMTDEGEHNIMGSMGSFMAGSVVRDRIAPMLSGVADKSGKRNDAGSAAGGASGAGSAAGANMAATSAAGAGGDEGGMSGAEDSASAGGVGSGENAGESSSESGSAAPTGIASAAIKAGNATKALGGRKNFDTAAKAIKGYMAQNGGSAQGFEKTAEAARIVGTGSDAEAKMEAVKSMIDIHKFI